MLYSASDKAKLLAENFSRNFNLDDYSIPLPVFPSRTNLKLHNISVTPKLVNRVITNLDLPKASGPVSISIPVVVLKNCEPWLSDILAKLFNMCLKESCFPDCWKVSLVVPVIRNVGERYMAKNYYPVSLLSMISKVFEDFVNNRFVDHIEKCGFLSNLQYGFSLLDLLLTVWQYLIELLGLLIGLRANQVVALDILKICTVCKFLLDTLQSTKKE